MSKKSNLFFKKYGPWSGLINRENFSQQKYKIMLLGI